MTFSRHFLRTYHFAYTQCVGVIDDTSLQVHLLSFKIESQGMTVIRELADIRGIERADKATVKGLAELAALDSKHSAQREEFLAIVVSDPLIREMAELYACSVKPGKQDVGIFDNIADALKWLGYREEEANKIRKFIRRHRFKATL